MGVIAYIWSGPGIEDPEEQQRSIQDYARDHGITIDRFIEIPWKKSLNKVEGETLVRGETIIVRDLSLLGRGLAEVVSRTDAIIRHGRLIAVKQDLDTGRKDQVPFFRTIESLFSMLSETGKNISRRRARQGIAQKRALGKGVGRPKGSLGKSKLEKHTKEIDQLMKDKPPITFIARKYNVSWITVDRFLKRKKLGKYSELYDN